MGSLLGVSESAGADFSFCTPSAPPTYTFKLIMTWREAMDNSNLGPDKSDPIVGNIGLIDGV
jgi:hypothetical protein